MNLVLFSCFFHCNLGLYLLIVIRSSSLPFITNRRHDPPRGHLGKMEDLASQSARFSRGDLIDSSTSIPRAGHPTLGPSLSIGFSSGSPRVGHLTHFIRSRSAWPPTRAADLVSFSTHIPPPTVPGVLKSFRAYICTSVCLALSLLALQCLLICRALMYCIDFPILSNSPTFPVSPPHQFSLDMGILFSQSV